MITADQIRAARALLRIGQEELARRAEISIATLRRLEAGDGGTGAASPTLSRVRRALEDAGADFIEDGVRRRRASTQADKEELVRQILAIADRAAARVAERPEFSEADLYDESGLPA
jgi:transcriptional regulator with XRE-family HTH domain